MIGKLFYIFPYTLFTLTAIVSCTLCTPTAFNNRSFAVFNINHPATHMFVSKTISLSPLDEHVLLPPKTLFKATSKANFSMALRVSSREVQDSGKDDKINAYTVELLYHVAGYLGSTNIDYYLTTACFIPQVVAKIMKAL